MMNVFVKMVTKKKMETVLEIALKTVISVVMIVYVKMDIISKMEFVFKIIQPVVQIVNIIL